MRTAERVVDPEGSSQLVVLCSEQATQQVVNAGSPTSSRVRAAR
jgi:hypothetical protein